MCEVLTQSIMIYKQKQLKVLNLVLTSLCSSEFPSVDCEQITTASLFASLGCRRLTANYCRWLSVLTLQNLFIFLVTVGLSSFSLQLILSKYHLYSTSTWCKSWISHGEFSAGAPKRANTGVDSVSDSRCYMLIPDRMRYHNEKRTKNKCVNTQRDKDISLDATRLS